MARITLDTYRDVIVARVAKRIDDRLLEIVTRSRNHVRQIHVGFFKEFSRLLTGPRGGGSDGPPSLKGAGVGGISWDPLVLHYTEKRYRRYKIPKTKFFNSGKRGKVLYNYLQRSNVNTVFGTPILAYRLGEEGDGIQVNFTQRGRGFEKVITNQAGKILKKSTSIPSTLKGFLELDAFPLIGGGIIDQYTAEQPLEDFLPGKIKWRLLNLPPNKAAGVPRGQRLLLRAYMIWWLKVKMKTALREGLK